MIVSRGSSGIEISLIGFPLHMGVSPSLHGLLLAMVQRAKRERWDSVEVGTFVYAKSPFVEGYDFGSFVGGFDHETEFLNPKAPTRLRVSKPVDERTGFVKGANVESFNAIVVVIRNKSGKNRTRCRSFLKHVLNLLRKMTLILTLLRVFDTSVHLMISCGPTLSCILQSSSKVMRK